MRHNLSRCQYTQERRHNSVWPGCCSTLISVTGSTCDYPAPSCQDDCCEKCLRARQPCTAVHEPHSSGSVGGKKQSITDLNIWFISFFASWGLKTTPGPLTGFIRLHYISPVLVSFHILMIYFKAWVGLEWQTGTVCPTWASHNLCTEHTTSFCFLIYGLDVTLGLYSFISYLIWALYYIWLYFHIRLSPLVLLVLAFHRLVPGFVAEYVTFLFDWLIVVILMVLNILFVFFTVQHLWKSSIW